MRNEELKMTLASRNRDVKMFEMENDQMSYRSENVRHSENRMAKTQRQNVED